jgi:two-component system chemotaxis response regulator CheY
MVSATSDYLKPISFLVADDRAYMRRVIKGILETLGCKRIDEAHHGGEALSIMRSWPPDIVITEWLFGPVSGLELLKTVRAEKGNIKFTPIIMITSETRREKVIQARNARTRPAPARRSDEPGRGTSRPRRASAAGKDQPARGSDARADRQAGGRR